ncbi:hypothetical protein V1264_013726 [Littorina saxatilis]|uniref:Uncharacterized protein n=1 Tax=Littorina saxatilis TaxID=31220 RepID=A0AAN9BQC5_9CAEN
MPNSWAEAERTAQKRVDRVRWRNVVNGMLRWGQRAYLTHAFAAFWKAAGEIDLSEPGAVLMSSIRDRFFKFKICDMAFSGV